PGARLGALRSAAVAAAAENRARTLVSDNFLFHYSLRGLHKVRTDALEDADLIRAADSLYARFADLPDMTRDSAVYANLDAAGAPHPQYVLKVRDYMEASWAYYVGNLGMRAPLSGVNSYQYKITASFPGKFPVDIVDIGTADSDYAGETYGVTYPPIFGLSISFENDFLHTTRLVDGKIVGRPIQSRLNGVVLHDYSSEWELGIKVTAFHEFYHGIQFTYVPKVSSYHAWYEISATGMEERNAGEVNDYLQYLPCVLYNHDRVPLNTATGGPPCSHHPWYGHGIFHQYLSKTLDSAFDVHVWTQLSRNGDALRDGLETTFDRYGKSMATLYPDYAAQLLFSGKRFSPPDSLFSPDMPLWPEISLDSVDMTSASPYRIITLPALTFGVLKVKWGAKAVPRILQAKVIAGISRVHATADISMVERLQETQFTLGAPRAGFQDYYLVLPNPSYTEKATIEIKDSDAVFYAFPNPVRTVFPSTLFFSQAKGMTFPAQVRIYGEDGRLVRGLDFASSNQSLTWDLKDARNRTVKPGVYYYRLAKDPLKVLVVLR
ncbi:MAG: hypothetical protein M3Y08_05230, partial [Fibrobacterota bacterium]|nr:hypothetical protein [Fibrobacterota bacterium]